MISSIINKEFLSHDNQINIIWTRCDNRLFEEFIRMVLPKINLIHFDQTYYGNNDVSLIICNNRIAYLDKCLELAKFYLSPILIVDHDRKSSYINNSSIDTNIYPIYSVAMSSDIYLSWERIQNSVLSYDQYDTDNLKSWKQLIFGLCKTNLLVKESV